MKIIKLLCVASASLLIYTHPLYSQGGTFKASVVRANITPETSKKLKGYPGPRLSTGIRDSIYHKVVMLDDGTTQFCLVSTDLCSISPRTYDIAAEQLEEQFGISREQFWWANTHTHSAPTVGHPGGTTLSREEPPEESIDHEYTDFVIQKLVEAVANAREVLMPAKLGAGWGYARANINRRARLVDNKTFLGENPDAPVDHRLGLIKIEKLDGKPLVLIANYPIHGTLLSTKDIRISGDVPGEVARYVEEQIGAPLVFLNGASGNIAPHFSVSVTNTGLKERELKQFQKLLGEPIVNTAREIVTDTRDVRLHTSSIIVETPKKPTIKAWPAYMGNYLRTTSIGEDLIRFPVSFLGINDIMVWSAPVELFCEVAMNVRADSPFLYTFYSGLTNGSFGYLCTDDELDMGGYEAGATPFVHGAAEQLGNEVGRHLDNLSRQDFK